MKEFNRIINIVRYHGKILLRGFTRMVYGALTAGLFALAIGGLIMITTESGWVAVSEFIASICTMVVAVTCMYAQGGGVKKGAKK